MHTHCFCRSRCISDAGVGRAAAVTSIQCPSWLVWQWQPSCSTPGGTPTAGRPHCMHSCTSASIPTDVHSPHIFLIGTRVFFSRPNGRRSKGLLMWKDYKVSDNSYRWMVSDYSSLKTYILVKRKKTKKRKDRKNTMMLAGPVTRPLPPCLCTTLSDHTDDLLRLHSNAAELLNRCTGFA